MWFVGPEPGCRSRRRGVKQLCQGLNARLDCMGRVTRGIVWPIWSRDASGLTDRSWGARQNQAAKLDGGVSRSCLRTFRESNGVLVVTSRPQSGTWSEAEVLGTALRLSAMPRPFFR